MNADELAGQTPRPSGSSTGAPATPHVGSHPTERGGEHGIRAGAGEHPPSPGTTRPPEATRWLETSLGLLSYQQLAPLLAERVGDLEAQVVGGAFASRMLDEDLLRELHGAICGDLVPQWAGVWRAVQVVVGQHHPPPPHELPEHMRRYADDLAARWDDSSQRDDERLLEMLAFAEGRLLSIHPFRDFNGRVTRVFLRELLRRLGLPGLSLAPIEPAAREVYLAALHAADSQYYHSLINIWKDRLESAPS